MQIIMKKLCNHCFKTFIIPETDICEDKWIKDTRCPFCKNIVHVWTKTEVLDIQNNDPEDDWVLKENLNGINHD